MVSDVSLRVVFFGTPAFAVPALDALLRSRHRVVVAVTQPDRPRGRGQKLTDAPVKARALAAGVPVLQPPQLKDPEFVESLRDLSADLGVVAAYGRILTEEVLAIPRLGMINVHASLLPRYRGAAPVHRAVMHGDAETGVTIMRVVKALDAGPMLAKVTRAIGPEETSEDVERDLAVLGADLLVRAVDALADGRATETPQDDSAATYAPRITKEEGRIDWSQPAARIHDRVRGLFPWPHAYTYLDGERLIVLRTAWRAEPSDAPPGTVVAAGGGRLDVAAGDGIVSLLEVQREGRRPMSAREYLAGRSIRPGARFVAPA